ncbi:hypothetical protein ACIP5Y_19810 [Nocardia sp. NPDC088792]|uniref:hypothetical protein n=1 Tax=Nocardia sp. NPDC088792 TaxID=3364332 RepID=UPI0038063207
MTEEYSALPEDSPNPALERRAADAELFKLLHTQGFTGPEWEWFQAEVARYAVAVLHAWLSTGHITMQLRAHKVRLTLYPSELRRFALEDEFRHGVVDTTVALALHTFRSRCLEDRGWRPDGEANLKTYLIRGCLYALYDEIRTQRRSEERYNRAVAAVAHHESARPDEDRYSLDDSVRRITGHDLLRHELRKLEPRDRHIVWGRAARKTFHEIAELFGEPSARTVERRWALLRNQHDWIRRLDEDAR